jgi:hypothetical protein
MVLPQSEVALYRAALRDVNTLAQRALLDVWRSFDFSDAKRVQDALTDELPGIIATHHGVAATVAADWYDLMRLESDVPGRFDAVVAEPPSLGRAVALVGRWAHCSVPSRTRRSPCRNSPVGCSAPSSTAHGRRSRRRRWLTLAALGGRGSGRVAVTTAVNGSGCTSGAARSSSRMTPAGA